MSFFKVVGYCSILVFCSSCSVPLDCFVYNNSGVVVEITKLNNEKVEYVRTIESGEVERLNGWELASYLSLIHISEPTRPY